MQKKDICRAWRGAAVVPSSTMFSSLAKRTARLSSSRKVTRFKLSWKKHTYLVFICKTCFSFRPSLRCSPRNTPVFARKGKHAVIRERNEKRVPYYFLLLFVTRVGIGRYVAWKRWSGERKRGKHGLQSGKRWHWLETCRGRRHCRMSR